MYYRQCDLTMSMMQHVCIDLLKLANVHKFVFIIHVAQCNKCVFVIIQKTSFDNVLLSSCIILDKVTLLSKCP